MAAEMFFDVDRTVSICNRMKPSTIKDKFSSVFSKFDAICKNVENTSENLSLTQRGLNAIMYQSIPSEIIPPGQTPGHLTFFKMSDQNPHYASQFHGQMPH